MCAEPGHQVENSSGRAERVAELRSAPIRADADPERSPPWGDSWDDVDDRSDRLQHLGGGLPVARLVELVELELLFRQDLDPGLVGLGE